MTGIQLLVRGFIIGFAIAAPVGPIGVICIRHSLTQGRKAGFLSGLGAASADAVYGCVAGFGLTFLSNILLGQQFWFQLIGGIFLIYLGLRTFLSRAASLQMEYASEGLWKLYASTFFLTLTNPMTLLSFGAIFAGLGLTTMPAQGYLPAIFLVAGVFCGSSSWWFILSGLVGILTNRLTISWMRSINRVSGILIIFFGMLAFASISGYLNWF